MSTLVWDTRAVFQREMSLVLRDPFSVIFSLVQPLVFLGLFGPLLAGSVDPAALNGASPLQWFLPGVIVMICLFGTSTTGANLLFEIMTGSYERVLASPLHRSALLIGKALKELAPARRIVRNDACPCTMLITVITAMIAYPAIVSTVPVAPIRPYRGDPLCNA